MRPPVAPTTAPCCLLMQEGASRPNLTATDAQPLATARATRRSAPTVYIACSSVSATVARRCREAVRVIGCATWLETEEEVCEHTLTHLVLGSDTRSVKCMLAATAGAHIVSPAWLERCWKEHTWLPVGVHGAKVLFSPLLYTAPLHTLALRVVHTCCSRPRHCNSPQQCTR
jgi:hypothetical protein